MQTFYLPKIDAQSVYYAPFADVIILQDTFYNGDTTEAVLLNNYLEPELQIFLKKQIAKVPCDDSPYQTVFSDDFSGTTLDTTKWLNEYPYPEPFNFIHNGGTNSVNLPENVVVDNGFLRLKTSKLLSPMSFEWVNSEGDSISKPYYWSSGVVYTNNFLSSSSNPSGCFRFGKFCAKIRIPEPIGHWGAYWLYGWPGEIDIFEFCLPECAELQTTLHQWNIPIPGFGPDDHPSYPSDHSFSGLTTSFHEYCLEWTPYKMVWSLDGQVFRTFYRYYKMDVDNSGVAFVGLDCESIPDTSSYTVYEHIAWNRFDVFYVDVILNTAIAILDNNEQENNSQSEMIIDWVKVEQKKDYQLQGETFLCAPTQTYTFSLTGTNIPSPVNWSVSTGLTIVHSTDTSIEVQPVTRFKGEAWVKVSLPNDQACFDQIIEKQVRIGAPFIAEVEKVSEPCDGWVSLFVTPHSTYNQYDWQITSGTGSIVATAQNAAQFEYTPDTYSIGYSLAVSNACGQENYSETIQLGECEGDQKDIHIFPNPANNQITVEFENFTTQELQNAYLYVIDPFLNTIKTQAITGNTETVTLDSIVPGYHYVAVPVSANNTVYSSKFLIQH